VPVRAGLPLGELAHQTSARLKTCYPSLVFSIGVESWQGPLEEYIIIKQIGTKCHDQQKLVAKVDKTHPVRLLMAHLRVRG